MNLKVFKTTFDKEQYWIAANDTIEAAELLIEVESDENARKCLFTEVPEKEWDDIKVVMDPDGEIEHPIWTLKEVLDTQGASVLASTAWA